MEAKRIDINEICDRVRKPSRPHITGEQETVTEEELKSRTRVTEELESLGISTSKFDVEDGYEDSDELQAIILVKQGKQVPEDLKKRLRDKQKKNQGRESNTKSQSVSVS